MKDYFQGQLGAWLVDGPVKDQRETLRDRVFNWFCAGCGLLLLILALGGCSTVPPQPEQPIPLHVLEKDNVEIRLMDLPCVDEVSRSIILPAQIHRFKAIHSVWPEPDGSRKFYAGCWTELTAEEAGGEEAFLVVFSDGKHAGIAKSEFKKVQGASGA
jgi:hypothetical protein